MSGAISVTDVGCIWGMQSGCNMETMTYLGITILSVIFTAGLFVGVTRMSFKNVESTLKVMQTQIQEVRDDQKAISELSTRMALVEQGLTNVIKCQDHIQVDMNILKKRNVKKIED